MTHVSDLDKYVRAVITTRLNVVMDLGEMKTVDEALSTQTFKTLIRRKIFIDKHCRREKFQGFLSMQKSKL